MPLLPLGVTKPLPILEDTKESTSKSPEMKNKEEEKKVGCYKFEKFEYNNRTKMWF